MHSQALFPKFLDQLFGKLRRWYVCFVKVKKVMFICAYVALDVPEYYREYPECNSRSVQKIR